MKKSITYRELHGYKYELMENCELPIEICGLFINTPYISLTEDGWLVIKKDYAWDGASGPAFDTKTIMRGSLVHDALYQLMREGFLNRKTHRKYADQLLKKICLEDGMWKLRANWVYWAVQSFAKRNSEPEKEPRGKIITT
jgi:hypothetical protein